MKTRIYLFIIFCITLFALGFFMLILLNIDPYKSDFLTISIFYITFAVFIMGIITLLGFYFRIKMNNNEVFFSNFKPALRQAFLITLVIVGLLILRTLRVLTWWDGIMFALAILLLELYFQNKKIIGIKDKQIAS